MTTTAPTHVILIVPNTHAGKARVIGRVLYATRAGVDVGTRAGVLDDSPCADFDLPYVMNVDATRALWCVARAQLTDSHLAHLALLAGFGGVQLIPITPGDDWRARVTGGWTDAADASPSPSLSAVGA